MKSVVDNIRIIIKWRRFICYETIIVFLVTLVICLLIPNQYTSTASILPPNPERDAMFGLIFSNIPSGLAGITSAGELFGGTTTSDLYAQLMQSQKIMREIIDEYDLKKIFKTKTIQDTYKELKNITKIIVVPEGIIFISVTHRDKYLAAKLANAFVEKLDKFNREIAMTTGKKLRMFIEQRLKETVDTLSKAEEALRAFQEQHRTVVLDIEIENAIATIAKLKSEIILREVQKGAVASVSNINNPYVANIEQELKELKRQLARIEFGTKDTTRKEFGAGFSVPFSKLPELSLEYARLLRDVKIQEAIYELLTQQYEQAKIIESKDTPTVQFLDQAVPAEKKSYPRRGILLITITFIGFLIGIIFTFFFENIEVLKNNPDEYSKWINIFSELKKDLIFIKQKLPIIKKL